MNKLIRRLLPFASLLLIDIALSIHDFSLHGPAQFLTLDNFSNVLRRSSVNAIIGVGMTAIIISGGIDLSVGSMLAIPGMPRPSTILKAGAQPLSPPSISPLTLPRVI